MHANKIDLIGERFGYLVVVEDTGKRKGQGVLWKCICDCGNEVEVRSYQLRSGKTKSCGCLHKKTTSRLLSINHKKTIDSRYGKSYVEGTALGNLRQGIPINNTSGHKGVRWVKRNKKWVATITFKQERIHLGYYSDKQDAINARLEAEEKYFKPILEKYEKKD
ncbi:hypothetical protein [Jeotgalibaca porci]|uniref:hypothetical protein n=1 Tax=Jeotgalibaca porci TaxID=1868793 RepID=UPI0035A0729F